MALIFQPSGGTAGNVVANRLTENPKFKVLVLEGGPSDAGVVDIQVPFLCTHLDTGTPYDWNYTTTVQPGLGNRASLIRVATSWREQQYNYLVYTRGSSDDFDRYAKVTGDSGWSWNKILPYFKKGEKFSPPADNHNTTGQFNPEVHGFNGIGSVTLSGFPSAIDSRVINASKQLGSPLGLGWAQMTATHDGRRSSSSASYLAPPFLARPNLHVVVNAQSRGSSRPGRRRTSSIPRRRVPPQTARTLIQLTASKEVIMSAGAVGSPHILLNSGIGDTKALKAVGVTPQVNLPDVGENLSDQALGVAAFTVSGNQTNDNLNPQWKSNATGPLVDTLVTHIVFARLDKSVLKGNPDPTAGPKSPHYELLIANGIPIGAIPPQGHFLAAGGIVLNPTARGSIKINSSDPFAAPIIDPALLGSEFDRITLREAMKSIKKFYTSAAWNGYVLAPTGGFENAIDDASIDKYNQENTQTIFHPVGSLSMSPKGSQKGVVDPDLTVKKVVGLRVVDASVLPFVPSAHTQAAAYVVGERGADLIKASYH
ncbi:aryl-alcohol-oxidase from pleurotus Eryingii [Infundibulicybe gibba]|nr:aryl-alcohol-oxidase from pleurotus Eryingii [Infundibulicybe gibba]